MAAEREPSKSQNLVTRNAFDLVHVLKGGILISNGKQTSCDLTVIDSKSSVVAASCLKYSTGTTIDSSANYQVYLSDGGDGGKAEFKVDKITVHPKYNPSTFANNIAVLQYNSNAKNSWQHLLATSASYEWDQLFFGRAVLADMEKLDWMLYYSTTSSNHDGICDKLSELFAENVDDMVCNGNTTGAAANYLSDCKIPYGTAFGIANNKAYVIGPYSHTAINNGNNLCASSMQRSYYTSLGNFAAFLSQTLGRDVLISDEYFHTNVSALNPDYTMIDRDFSDDNGLKATIVSAGYRMRIL
ncbi:hypothetical protein IWW54_003347 [Coemansia sp. RSA 2705]|nr:hypothetical protein IWW54_003347 [Coemansia sp. RSA 2705]